MNFSLKNFYTYDIFCAAGSSMCRLLPRRKEVTRMDIKDWIELICLVGSFVLSLIDHFNGKK